MQLLSPAESVRPSLLVKEHFPASAICSFQQLLWTELSALSQRSHDARVRGSQGGMDESSRFLFYGLSLANTPLFQ